MASIAPVRGPNARKLRRGLFFRKSLQQCLSIVPIEVVTDILSFTMGYTVTTFPNSWADLVNVMPTRALDAGLSKNNPASKPLTNGASPFLNIPFDVRRTIYDYILPDSKIIAPPKSREDREPTRVGTDTLNLLVVNQQVNAEVSDLLYRETIFRLRISPKGIRLLHHPIMPLDINGYYMEVKSDDNVFNSPNGRTGFNNMRHLDIALWAPDRGSDWKADCLTLRALVQSLVNIRGKARLYTMSITLIDSLDKPGSYWWNPETNTPRMSPFHDMSMIEVVTQPLEQLRNLFEVRVNYSNAIPPEEVSNPIMQSWERRFISLLRSTEPYAVSPETATKIQQINDAWISLRCHQLYGRKMGSGLKDDADISKEISAEGLSSMVKEDVSEGLRAGGPSKKVKEKASKSKMEQEKKTKSLKPMQNRSTSQPELQRVQSIEHCSPTKRKQQSEVIEPALTKSPKQSPTSSPRTPERPESEHMAEESIMDIDAFSLVYSTESNDGVRVPPSSPEHPSNDFQFSQPADFNVFRGPESSQNPMETDADVFPPLGTGSAPMGPSFDITATQESVGASNSMMDPQFAMDLTPLGPGFDITPAQESVGASNSMMDPQFATDLTPEGSGFDLTPAQPSVGAGNSTMDPQFMTDFAPEGSGFDLTPAQPSVGPGNSTMDPQFMTDFAPEGSGFELTPAPRSMVGSSSMMGSQLMIGSGSVMDLESRKFTSVREEVGGGSDVVNPELMKGSTGIIQDVGPLVMAGNSSTTDPQSMMGSKIISTDLVDYDSNAPDELKTAVVEAQALGGFDPTPINREAPYEPDELDQPFKPYDPYVQGPGHIVGEYHEYWDNFLEEGGLLGNSRLAIEAPKFFESENTTFGRFLEDGEAEI